MKQQLRFAVTALLAIFLIGALSGCKKNIDDKITGDWHFDIVRLYSGLFSFQNITNDYRDYKLSFSSDGTFYQHNTRTGEIINGSWKINRTTVTNDDNTVTVQTLILSFDDPQYGFPDIHIWDEFQLTNRKMMGTENRNGDVYRFTLRK